jgi:hypothetical protein
MSRQLAINELAQEERHLNKADGLAHGQSKARIANLYHAIGKLDSKVIALTEAELFTKDREAAISRAVQISQLRLMQTLIANAFAGSDNEIGLTPARYTAICNELYRALKELGA